MKLRLLFSFLSCISYYSTPETYLFNFFIFPTALTGSFFTVASIHFSLFFKIDFINIAKIPIFYIELNSICLTILIVTGTIVVFPLLVCDITLDVHCLQRCFCRKSERLILFPNWHHRRKFRGLHYRHLA